MEYKKTEFEGLYVLTPKVFADDRGYFYESYHKQKEEQASLEYKWIQDNESYSARGVLRGLHYQCAPHGQAKLVRVIQGKVQDIAVDIRKESTTYGKCFSIILDDVKKQQLLIPRGFAHGFLVLSKTAIFSYKCDNFYNKESEGGIHYSDAELNVSWEMNDGLIISEKDKLLPTFGNHRTY